MTGYMKWVPGLFVAAAALALSACGEGSETNTPSVPLTASTVASQTTNAHTHTVVIPFTDVSAAPASAVYPYRSSDANGHSHVIALSQQQMIDLNNGMQLTLTSSAQNTGTSHTHTWILQGGSVLYEKNCFNCHSNDKRNRTPMNVSFNASQTSAVINPLAAPQSTSAAATPDPAYTLPTSPTPATPTNGASVYTSKCAGCHRLGTVDTVGSAPDLSGKGALVNGKFPTPNVVSHNGQFLTAAEIAAIINYFNAN